MKKILGLFMIVMIMIFVRTQIVKAEDSKLYGSVNGSFSGEVKGDNIKRMLPPGQNIPEDALPEKVKFNGEIKDGRVQLHEDIKLQKGEIRADIKAGRDAMQENIKNSEMTSDEKKVERDAFKKEVETKKAEFKTNIKEKRTEFRMKVKGILGEKFQNAIKKLGEIQTRIGTRIETLKAEGKDTTIAETALANSKAKLESAIAKLAEVKAIMPSTDAEVTADLFEKIKVGTREAQDLLKDSRTELRNALNALKALQTPQVETNTSVENKTETQ